MAVARQTWVVTPSGIMYTFRDTPEDKIKLKQILSLFPGSKQFNNGDAAADYRQGLTPTPPSTTQTTPPTVTGFPPTTQTTPPTTTQLLPPPGALPPRPTPPIPSPLPSTPPWQEPPPDFMETPPGQPNELSELFNLPPGGVANAPAPGSPDWWSDQPYGAQWLNRLKLGGQIGAGGAPVNPYQSWLVDQSTRARNLNWMQKMTQFAGGQPISQFGSAQIPWGGGRNLFKGLAGQDPQSVTGSAFGSLTPEQATSMAYTASRGVVPDIMRQQMNTGDLYNRYLAGAGTQQGAQGFAPWLSGYYGF